MSSENDMLNSIRKTTHMGSFGIKMVKDETMNSAFREALTSQQKEYEEIFNEADSLLRARGGKLRNINPMAKMGTAVSSKLRIRSSQDATAKIAEMMLEGNTKGMIKSIHNIRTMGVVDPKVSALSNRLLQTEQANIDQMKEFL